MAELRVKSTGTLKLFENDNTSSVTIASPASLGGDRTITLPDASVTLASGTMLATDGDGSSLTGIPVLTGSTNNTITTVTAANAISGETNLTFDGTDLTLGTGNIIFGTASKGVYLGVTSAIASNLLDDYEEGNWTPALVGTTSVSYSNATGRYTKTGNLVFVECLLQWHTTTYTTDSDPFTVSGLPFTPIGIHYCGVPGACATGASFNWNNTESTSTTASIAAAATASSTVVFTVGASTQNFTNSRVINDNNPAGIVSFALSYRTAA